MSKPRNFLVGLDPDVDAALREAARREERTLKSIIQRALRNELGLLRSSQNPPAMAAVGNENA